jgi:hypothetical protein
MQDSTKIVRRNSERETKNAQAVNTGVPLFDSVKFPLHGKFLVSQVFYISEFSCDLRQ